MGGRTTGGGKSQVAQTGYRPIRMTGHVDQVDKALGEVRRIYSTEHEPDDCLLLPCRNRREWVCPPCAEVYRGDTYHLILAGLVGGKGVPETVVDHPAAFATFTAPSFGAVHGHRMKGKELRGAIPGGMRSGATHSRLRFMARGQELWRRR